MLFDEMTKEYGLNKVDIDRLTGRVKVERDYSRMEEFYNTVVMKSNHPKMAALLETTLTFLDYSEAHLFKDADTSNPAIVLSWLYLGIEGYTPITTFGFHAEQDWEKWLYNTGMGLWADKLSGVLCSTLTDGEVVKLKGIRNVLFPGKKTYTFRVVMKDARDGGGVVLKGYDNGCEFHLDKGETVLMGIDEEQK